MSDKKQSLSMQNFFVKQRRKIAKIKPAYSDLVNTHFIKRFNRLVVVRRFVVGWVSLIILLVIGLVWQNIALNNHFQAIRPADGGIYKEGILGSFSNANPMYATSNADMAVSRLVFAGLLKHDADNKLVGELADSYTVDDKGLIYTVKLKPGLKWHDRQPLTSKDIEYTFTTIQNAEAQSPLRPSWQGVTISTPNDQTIEFKLPNPSATFLYSLTTGIVPKHILSKVPFSDLRSAEFNTIRPVGSGPFVWQAIDVQGTNPQNTQQQIALLPNENYSLGKPKLAEFIINTYADQQRLINDFSSGRLTAISGVNNLPTEVTDEPEVEEYSVPLNAANMVFFKTSEGILADKDVRKALVQATNVPSIIKSLSYNARAVHGPLLDGQVGFDRTYSQASYNFDEASKQLEAKGWVKGSDGVRQKNGQKLSFKLVSSDNAEFKSIGEQLKKQWRLLGVDVKIDAQKPSDFQSTLSYHSYDALLYGISIGSDPDVFVYWASSQAGANSNKLNFSEFKNSSADNSLEAGRTRLDPAIRAIKYRPFLQAWQQETPALGLYQPRLLYATNGVVFGFDEHSIDSPTGRFNNVHNWQIRQARTTYR